MKKWVRIAAIVVAVLITLSFARDFTAKFVIARVASKVIGAPVRMEGFSLGLLSQSVRIKGLRIYNPPGFPREPFVDISTVAVSWDPAAFLAGKIHLRSVEFDLKELDLVKESGGKTNVDSLPVVHKAAKQKEEKKPAKEMPFQIDELKLAIGKLVHKDNSVSPPTIQVYNVNVKRTYKNITSPQQIALLVISEPLKTAGIKSATLYAASAMTGVGMVPMVAGSILLGNDKAQADYSVGFGKAYEVSLDILKKMGEIKTEDKAQGIITADLPGAGVTIKLTKLSWRSTRVTVSARKMMMPKPEIAGGVLYQISDRLK